MNHEYFMERALQESYKALDEGEVPIGAVIVRNGKVIGRGYNRTEQLKDATGHAEIIAISSASSLSESWRLNGSTLYVTLEPCLMCLGAILLTRLDSIIYGSPDPRIGAIESHSYHQTASKAYDSFPECMGGVLEYPCKDILQQFFKKMRKKN